MRNQLLFMAAALVAALAFSACSTGNRSEGGNTNSTASSRNGTERVMDLPSVAGAWSRPATPKRIDRDAIFSYMDGAGELYLAYRFDHLDVYEYTAAGRDPILVELYFMQSSDDAFGLLANDWGGETISLQDNAESPTGAPVPQSRALYGGGLLRIWSDALYARILAARDTPEAREQVLALGRAIVAGRGQSPRPELLRSLPQTVGDRYTIRQDRVWFLRSPLVLNSAYYLGTENLLDLSADAEAVVAPYAETAASKAPERGSARPNSRQVQLILVRYPDSGRARRATEHFVTGYLRGQASAADLDEGVIHARQIEHGWVAYRVLDRRVWVLFDAPDEKTATAFLRAVPAATN